MLKKPIDKIEYTFTPQGKMELESPSTRQTLPRF